MWACAGNSKSFGQVVPLGLLPPAVRLPGFFVPASGARVLFHLRRTGLGIIPETDPTITMSFSLVFRTLAILGLLFVVLYVGMNNTHTINFYFPIAGTTDKSPIHTSAALIFFGLFAIGVFAGLALHTGGGGKGKGSSAKRSGKER